jgi:hypothetical protein
MWERAASWRFVVSAFAVVAAFALLCATAGAAAKTEVQPAEERIDLTLEHKRPGSRPDTGEGTHVLSLFVYPLRGVAVATTASNNYDIENNTSVSYAEQIPKGPFDGHLDLHFKGLGSFDGYFDPRKDSPERRPTGCLGPPPTFQIGQFVGRVRFHGGGYARWSLSRALMLLSRSPRLQCRRGAAKRERKPKTLLDYVNRGPGSFSGWRYSLYARVREPHRFTELEFFRYEAERPLVHFDAATFEYLPNEIAVGRFINRAVRGGAHFEASHGGYHPETATLRPPEPYSGVGAYNRSTHRLTGALAVQFPGLRLRLGGTHTVANLVDEARLPEKKATENQ